MFISLGEKNNPCSFDGTANMVAPYCVHLDIFLKSYKSFLNLTNLTSFHLPQLAEHILRFRFCYEKTTRISSQYVAVPRKIGSVTTS